MREIIVLQRETQNIENWVENEDFMTFMNIDF